MEPAQAYRLIGKKVCEVIQAPLHGTPQPSQHPVLYKDVQVVAEEEENQEGQQNEEADRSNMHHVGLEAQESPRVAPEVCLVYGKLEIVPDEPLMLKNHIGKQRKYRHRH